LLKKLGIFSGNTLPRDINLTPDEIRKLR